MSERLSERSKENEKEVTLHSKEKTEERKEELYQVFTAKNDEKNPDIGKYIENQISINDAKENCISIDNFSQRVGLTTDLMDDADTNTDNSDLGECGRDD